MVALMVAMTVGFDGGLKVVMTVGFDGDLNGDNDGGF